MRTVLPLAALQLALAALLIAAIECAATPSAPAELSLSSLAPAEAPQRRIGEFVNQPDYRTRGGRWSFEHVTAQSLRGPAVRGNLDFVSDPSLPDAWRPRHADYDGSGWAIGHEARAGNYGHASAKRATFDFYNAAPQDPTLNSEHWSAIERYCVAGVDADHERYIWTGALFIADAKGIITIQTIGARQIWVPTHFAKAVLFVDGGVPARMVAWLVPNEACASQDVTLHRVSVDELEAESGEDLFPGLDDRTEAALEATAE